MSARVCVGITNYNDADYLDMLLQTIRWYTVFEEPFDIVVYDDGTEAINPDMANQAEHTAYKYGAAFIRNTENKGIPYGWNCVGNATDSEIIVWLNNDMLMVPYWLKAIVYFIDQNKDNPHFGSVFLQPHHVERTHAKEHFKVIMDTLAHTVPKWTDPFDNTERRHEWHQNPIFQERDGEGQGSGKVMCPCGCSFATTRKIFEEVGPFDEAILSFHEESDWGVRACEKGRAHFALSYPRPYHVISGTFMDNPSLRQETRMRASRKYFRQKHGIPANYNNPKDMSGFKLLEARYFEQIPKTKVKFLTPNYGTKVELKLNVGDGADPIYGPELIEKEEEV